MADLRVSQTSHAGRNGFVSSVGYEARSFAQMPYYAVQLCCLLGNARPGLLGGKDARKFGIILGAKEGAEFRVEDFLHYYQRIEASFLAMKDGFTGQCGGLPRAAAER